MVLCNVINSNEMGDKNKIILKCQRLNIKSQKEPNALLDLPKYKQLIFYDSFQADLGVKTCLNRDLDALL